MSILPFDGAAGSPDGRGAGLPPASRRRLTPRQADMLARLLQAAADEARDNGYDGMTVRSAARRAGVAPATAYTHFASKDHLLAEVMRRKMAELVDAPPADSSSAEERVVAELRLLGTFMADDPGLAAAGTIALLGTGAEVRAVRAAIGAAFHSRIAGALGGGRAEDRSATVLQTLDLVYTGALLWMGMGHLAPHRVPQVLVDAAHAVMRGDR